MKTNLTSKRVWIARFIAIGADVLQIWLFPLVAEGFLSPLDNILDVVVCAALTMLVGWHFVFLPSFLTKMIPGIDLAPTWTIAVLLATRKKAPDVIEAETVITAPGKENAHPQLIELPPASATSTSPRVNR